MMKPIIFKLRVFCLCMPVSVLPVPLVSLHLCIVWCRSTAIFLRVQLAGSGIW